MTSEVRLRFRMHKSLESAASAQATACKAAERIGVSRRTAQAQGQQTESSQDARTKSAIRAVVVDTNVCVLLADLGAIKAWGHPAGSPPVVPV